MEIWNTIFECLQSVVKGQCNYDLLQRIVDNAIIEGKIPDEYSDERSELLYELQTQLELIAEHQSSHLSLSSSYGDAEIISLLDDFAAQMERIGVDDENSG